jgi:single-stranded DNA-binding protein
MKGLNSINIAGNLVAAPEILEVGGYTAAKFTLAVNENLPKKRKDAEGYDYVPTTTYFDCEAWGALAMLMKKSQLVKGAAVIVSGRCTVSEYDGNLHLFDDEKQVYKAVKTRRTVIVASEVVICSNGEQQREMLETVVSHAERTLVKLNGEDMPLSEYASKCKVILDSKKVVISDTEIPE